MCYIDVSICRSSRAEILREADGQTEAEAALPRCSEVWRGMPNLGMKSGSERT